MRWSFLARAVLGVLLQPALFALVLFYPPGDFAWRRAWALVVVAGVASAASMWTLARNDPALLAERFRPPVQAGQPTSDRVLVLLFLATLAGAIRFVPLDVFGLRLLPPPGFGVALLGFGLVVVGWTLVIAVLRANAFAVPVVKAQTARRQHVVERGPYALVRHPMYAGVTLVTIGTPLWLGSFAGALVALVPIAVLMMRIVCEERFLRRTLAGYDDYAARVSSRLIPGLW